MLLKNFSFLKTNTEYHLCPAYDLAASELFVKGYDEEPMLKLNGKKKKIKKSDFETAMLGAGLTPKVIENIFTKFKKLLPKWIAFIDQSFINNRMKNENIKRKSSISYRRN